MATMAQRLTPEAETSIRDRVRHAFTGNRTHDLLGFAVGELDAARDEWEHWRAYAARADGAGRGVG